MSIIASFILTPFIHPNSFTTPFAPPTCTNNRSTSAKKKLDTPFSCLVGQPLHLISNMAQSLRRIIWSVVIVVGCYLALWAWLQQSNSQIEDAPTKAPEVLPQTDLRALLTNGDLCTRKANRKPRGPFTGKERWRGERLRQIVVESRKALYCSLGRIGCSRWRRLLMKADGFPLFTKELEVQPV